MRVYGIQDASPRALLSLAAAREFGVPVLPEISYDRKGKPFFPERPDLCFNWSHSGPLVVCTVSRRPVGVDIERICPRRDGLVEYVLSAEELEEYDALGGGWPAFYALWTRREAWCKYTGDGLRARWRDPPPKDGLYFGAYAGDGWRAAVCGEEAPPEEIVWVRKEDLP